MPWKSASGAGPNKLGTTRSKSIRGQISAPIPVPDPMEQDAIDNKAQMAAETKDEAAAEKANTSPPRSRPTTIVKPPPERATNHSSMASSAGQGATSRLSKSTTITAARPEREKSTIRKVFGKLFGRGKKSPSRTSKFSYGDEAPSHPQHRSDPTGDTKPPINESLEARANSVPVTEYDRALRSHSIGPEDVLAIQSARNSLAAEHSLVKKRNGGTNSPHAFGARYIGGGKLAGLSPRPASVNDRYDGSSYGVDDPNEIGRAITSDAKGLKRRSRSLSAIPSFEAARPRRHRSDDLRFWRDSYDVDFLSPMSSNFPEDDLLSPRSDALGIKTTACHEEPITPAQQFDFGSMAITRDVNHPDDTEEMAPSGKADESGDRVYQLQDAMARLDGSAQACATPAAEWDSPSKTGVLGLGTEPSVAHSSTTAGYQSQSMDMHESSRPSTRSSVHDALASSGVSKLLQAPGALKSTTRPMSENTVTERETMIFDNAKKSPGPFTEEHYATLLGLLETERSARMALEAQVRLLTHQVTVLMRHAGPGEDTELAVGGGASVSTTSAFDDDDDDDADNEGRRYGDHGYGRKMLDDSGFGADVRDDDEESSQSFATPHEDEDRTFGIYTKEEEVLDEQAPRAMSLSQMTMGRMPMQATVV